MIQRLFGGTRTKAHVGRGKITKVVRRFQQWRDQIVEGQKLLAQHMAANEEKMADMRRENDGILEELMQADKMIAGFDKLMNTERPIMEAA